MAAGKIGGFDVVDRRVNLFPKRETPACKLFLVIFLLFSRFEFWCFQPNA
jgi:hypothetical protein